MPPKSINHEEIWESYIDMKFIRHDKYLVIGDWGLTEIDHGLVEYHLTQDTIQSIHRICEHQYLLNNQTEEKLQIYDLKDKMVLETIFLGLFS